MRFLADMGLARSTVTFLRVRGHDAVHLREQGLQRLDDEVSASAASVCGSCLSPPLPNSCTRKIFLNIQSRRLSGNARIISVNRPLASVSQPHVTETRPAERRVSTRPSVWQVAYLSCSSLTTVTPSPPSPSRPAS
jgi:hypothetical protein